MTYTEFKNRVKNYPLFSTSQLNVIGPGDSPTLRNQISSWKGKGLLIKLRNNLYMLNEHDRKLTPSHFFLANQIYAPSYVSLESALSFYDLIPERVFSTTSVSTKKTAQFVNELGTFVYQNIKPNCFLGYSALRDDNNLPFFMATPEKALVDYLYLNLKKFDTGTVDIFEESLRLQNCDQLRLNHLTHWASHFENKRLKKVIKRLCAFIKAVELKDV